MIEPILLDLPCSECRGTGIRGIVGCDPDWCYRCGGPGLDYVDMTPFLWNVWTAITLAAAERQGRRISNHHQKDVRKLTDAIDRVARDLAAARGLAAMVDSLEHERRRAVDRGEAFYLSLCRERARWKAGVR